METDYLSTALAKASKGKKMGGDSVGTINKDTHDADDGADTEDGVGEGHHVAAREMMDCHESGDHEGYAKALHSFIKMSQ